MSAITQVPQSRPHRVPARFQARPAGRWITALHRRAPQRIAALTRRARCLHLPRRAGHRLEPMPRLRWYS